MKKWLVFTCLLFTACSKEDIVPVVPPTPKVIDVFSVSESTISDGDEVMIKLPSDSVYVLKLVDKMTNQVISKEKISGKIGENTIKLYTKSIQTPYLYLLLESVTKKEISKTTIIIK